MPHAEIYSGAGVCRGLSSFAARRKCEGRPEDMESERLFTR